ncbi:SDR family NAD(P)-dependent oxidoreductase [Halobellus clavatus]|uniref:NAD(P)-dependent dehydrogenase, short-chain alcohol dehydrogenase family n=1 Tax=Halobellus clavatus TaxID=660517 RepID=A0A1H3JSV4_9EURY|nr:SDR family oxidoreductase [Halobellus clavatus]SDY42344.1 NAD(P)-dependent dehydrogenase, short-chain alcohol dehydrogenase family [Halobellus clavatus]
MSGRNIVDLSTLTAVITGSTRGIGAATARRLADMGANVVVSGRTASDGQEVVNEITSAGGSAVFVQTDVREPSDLRTLVEITVEEFGGIDAVVNNAGFETDTSPEEVTLDTWEAIVETDLRAYWLMGKYAYPYLKESDDAAIVNIGSNHGQLTQPKKFPYNVVKTAIDGLTRSMAVAWGADGIRVNTVAPGWIEVERVRRSIEESDKIHLEKIHPLGRIGDPTDVANIVVFLLSDLSSFVTGSRVLVDGGRSAVLQDNMLLRDLDVSRD